MKFGTQRFLGTLMTMALLVFSCDEILARNWLYLAKPNQMNLIEPKVVRMRWNLVHKGFWARWWRWHCWFLAAMRSWLATGYIWQSQTGWTWLNLKSFECDEIWYLEDFGAPGDHIVVLFRLRCHPGLQRVIPGKGGPDKPDCVQSGADPMKFGIRA